MQMMQTRGLMLGQIQLRYEQELVEAGMTTDEILEQICLAGQTGEPMTPARLEEINRTLAEQRKAWLSRRRK